MLLDKYTKLINFNVGEGLSPWWTEGFTLTDFARVENYGYDGSAYPPPAGGGTPGVDESYVSGPYYSEYRHVDTALYYIEGIEFFGSIDIDSYYELVYGVTAVGQYNTRGISVNSSVVDTTITYVDVPIVGIWADQGVLKNIVIAELSGVFAKVYVDGSLILPQAYNFNNYNVAKYRRKVFDSIFPTKESFNVIPVGYHVFSTNSLTLDELPDGAVINVDAIYSKFAVSKESIDIDFLFIEYIKYIDSNGLPFEEFLTCLQSPTCGFLNSSESTIYEYIERTYYSCFVIINSQNEYFEGYYNKYKDKNSDAFYEEAINQVFFKFTTYPSTATSSVFGDTLYAVVMVVNYPQRDIGVEGSLNFDDQWVDVDTLPVGLNVYTTQVEKFGTLCQINISKGVFLNTFINIFRSNDDYHTLNTVNGFTPDSPLIDCLNTNFSVNGGGHINLPYEKYTELSETITPGSFSRINELETTKEKPFLNGVMNEMQRFFARNGQYDDVYTYFIPTAVGVKEFQGRVTFFGGSAQTSAENLVTYKFNATDQPPSITFAEISWDSQPYLLPTNWGDVFGLMDTNLIPYSVDLTIGGVNLTVTFTKELLIPAEVYDPQVHVGVVAKHLLVKVERFNVFTVDGNLLTVSGDDFSFDPSTESCETDAFAAWQAARENATCESRLIDKFEGLLTCYRTFFSTYVGY